MAHGRTKIAISLAPQPNPLFLLLTASVGFRQGVAVHHKHILGDRKLGIDIEKIVVYDANASRIFFVGTTSTAYARSSRRQSMMAGNSQGR